MKPHRKDHDPALEHRYGVPCFRNQLGRWYRISDVRPRPRTGKAPALAPWGRPPIRYRWSK